MAAHSVLLVHSDDCGWTDLRQTLALMPDVQVVGEATTTSAAMGLARRRKPSVVIAATRLAGASAFPLLTELRLELPAATKIMIIGSRLDVAEMDHLADLRIAAHLLWSDLTLDVLRHCLATVFAADIVAVSRSVAETFVAAQCHPPAKPEPAIVLDEREQTVLRHLVHGRTRQAIAEMEPMGKSTVGRTIRSLEDKLGARKTVTLAWKAGKLGLPNDEG